MAQRTSDLALEGGAPVRTTPWPRYKGASLIGAEEKAAVLEVLESQSLFRYYGPRLLRKVEAFEQAFAAYLGAAYCLATSSGTAALRVGLAALGVGPGDEVIVPAITFIASANAVLAQQALPVFAEVDETLTLDIADVATRITPRTRAIMAVHLGGIPTRMDALLTLARERGLVVIEDVAQACGAQFQDRALGTWGAVGAFSFQQEKNITAGEGGALVTNDPLLYQRAAIYHDQGGQFTLGAGGDRVHEGQPIVGENLRMGEVAGAILGVQLRRLPFIVERLRWAKKTILDLAGDLPGLQPRPSPDPEGEVPASLDFLVETPERAEAIARALTAEGIPARRIYGGKPVYVTPSLMRRSTYHPSGRPFSDPLYGGQIPPYGWGLCPRSEAIVARTVGFSLSPLLTEADCQDAARALRKVARSL